MSAQDSTGNDVDNGWNLSSDVRIVRGKNEAAIYQFSKQRLIRISNEVADVIEHGLYTPMQKRQLLAEGLLAGCGSGSFIEDSDSGEIGTICTAWLELTPSCNLRCSHCYMGDVLQDECNIDKAKWLEIIDYLLQWNCKNVIFLGGEPLLSPILPALLSHLRKHSKSIHISVITNGTTLSDKWLEIFKNDNVSLRFSLLGITARMHDGITMCQGSFDKLITSIHKAQTYGIDFDIGITLLPETQSFRGDFIDFCKREFDVSRVKFSHVRPQGRFAKQPRSGGDEREFCRLDITKPFFENANRHHTCLYGKTVFSYTGKVHPCIMARYAEQNLESVLGQPPLQAFKEWWFLTKDKINGCKYCAMRYGCFDCRGYANDLYSPPSNCHLATQLSELG